MRLHRIELAKGNDVLLMTQPDGRNHTAIWQTNQVGNADR